MDHAASVLGQDEPPRPAAPPRVVDSARDQFDWWDAAIGAAAGLGLLLVVVGARQRGFAVATTGATPAFELPQRTAVAGGEMTRSIAAPS